MIGDIFKWIGLFLLCFVLQSTLVPVISIWGIKPDLLLIALFLLGSKLGMLPAIYVGFFLGLTQDIYGEGILGQHALAKTVAGCFGGMFNEKVIRVDIILQAVLLVALFFIDDVIVFTVQATKNSGNAGAVLADLLKSTAPKAIYSLLFAAVPIVWDSFFKTTPLRK